MRNNPSPGEQLLWSYLRKDATGYRFGRQRPMFGWIADFYSPALGLVIEVDGEQHYSDQWQAYKDDRKDKFLRGKGLHVYRIRAKTLLSNPEHTIEGLRTLIRGIAASCPQGQPRTRKGGHPAGRDAGRAS